MVSLILTTEFNIAPFFYENKNKKQKAKSKITKELFDVQFKI